MTEMAGVVCHNLNRNAIDDEKVNGVVSCGLPDRNYAKIILRDGNNFKCNKGEILINSLNLFNGYFNFENSNFVYYSVYNCQYKNTRGSAY